MLLLNLSSMLVRVKKPSGRCLKGQKIFRPVSFFLMSWTRCALEGQTLLRFVFVVLHPSSWWWCVVFEMTCSLADQCKCQGGQSVVVCNGWCWGSWTSLHHGSYQQARSLQCCCCCCCCRFTCILFPCDVHNFLYLLLAFQIWLTPLYCDQADLTRSYMWASHQPRTGKPFWPPSPRWTNLLYQMPKCTQNAIAT